MKKLFVVCAFAFAFFNCNSQRYEVWVKPFAHKYESVRNLGYFNDSILSVYSNPTFFILSKDFTYRWSEIEEIKIRNKSINQLGSFVGLGVGLIGFDLYYKSLDDKANIFAPIFMAPTFLLGGSLAGYLLTNKKIIIPLTGKTPAEKSQALEDKIKKRSR
ncbi:MAG: hypothetical protein K9H49_12440 [Bacteroidales bacterium]|nr:hypothetical protein [Bacteroidales bacterium]MCF8390605.1 hypothetical protein [Bacteroidales bacterium]